MRLQPADTFHGEITLFGIYEDEVSQRIHSSAAASGGILVDVGANYGYFSLLWCAAKLENSAHAIGAAQLNVEPLRVNITHYQFGQKITVHEWAASNEEGMVTFDLTSTEETGWRGITRQDAENPFRMPAHRLDEAFQGQEIAVLKIDCEGADALVIEGAEGLLAEKRIKHVFLRKI